jgi:hypothetical protein
MEKKTRPTKLERKIIDSLKSLRNVNNPWVQMAILLVESGVSDPIGMLCETIDRLIDMLEINKGSDYSNKRKMSYGGGVSTTPCAHEWVFIVDITTGGEKHYAKCKKCGMIRYNFFTQ